ncbi:hypothetical protein AOY95_16240 [Escherichia coli]|nr:hypothetical protein AOY95_16240 [Escherichia coli]
MPSAESNDTIKISQRTIAHIVSWSQIIRATVAQIVRKQQLTCQPANIEDTNYFLLPLKDDARYASLMMYIKVKPPFSLIL